MENTFPGRNLPPLSSDLRTRVAPTRAIHDIVLPELLNIRTPPEVRGEDLRYRLPRIAPREEGQEGGASHSLPLHLERERATTIRSLLVANGSTTATDQLKPELLDEHIYISAHIHGWDYAREQFQLSSVWSRLEEMDRNLATFKDFACRLSALILYRIWVVCTSCCDL